MNYKSKAHFYIVSHEIDPDNISKRLGIEYDEAVWKGAPNPSGNLKLHPFHIIMFHSHLSDSHDMDKHAKDILSRILPIRSRIKSLPDTCNASLNFHYRMSQDGGWSFNPSIMSELSKLSVPCVFSLDVETSNEKK